MNERLKREEKIFKKTVEELSLDYGHAVTLGSYPGMLNARIRELEEENLELSTALNNARKEILMLKRKGE